MVRPSLPRAQKSGFFKQPVTPKSMPKKEVYYEDLYGSPNEDEIFDRFPDACESESSSEDEKKSKRKSKKSRSSRRHKQFFSGSYAGNSSIREKRYRPTDASIDEQSTETRYKNATDKNSSRSIEVSSVDAQDVFDGSATGSGVEGPDLDDFTSISTSTRRRGLATRTARLVSRRLFQEELAERDKNKKKQKVASLREEKIAARRKGKTDVRRGNLSKKTANLTSVYNEQTKFNEDLGADEADSEVLKGNVLVDLSGVNVAELELFYD